MHWISFLPKAVTLHWAQSGTRADAHAAEVRDCAIAMAAYLPPGGGIMAGGCFVQLLDLIDEPAEAVAEAATTDDPTEAASPKPLRH